MTARTRGTDTDRLVEAAVRYAAHGWPVIPLHTPLGQGCSCPAAHCGSPGKHPRTTRGLHDATTDTDQVRTWWTRWPTANIGVTTGPASSLVVIDVDLPDGPRSLARMEAEHGDLPRTCSQRTGSGGRQMLFTHPGVPVGNRAGIEPGLDVRADGGYIVVPPSLHASGRRYRWIHRVPPVPAPDWLVAQLDRSRVRPREAVPPVQPLPTGTEHQRYAAAAMDGELAQLAVAVEGTRNHTLNRAAFNLGQLAGAGLLDRDHVAAELERVATGIGLPDLEARRTVASGLTAGLQNPRPLPAASDASSIRAPRRAIGARRR